MYNLELIKLETLNIDINNNLTKNFIKLSKFFIKFSIFLNKKLD